LKELNFNTGPKETPFSNRQELPDLTLLAIKWHMDKNTAYWHWVVFVRESQHCYVLDSKKSLKNNKRTDFGRIKPKWYIPVYNN